MKNNSIDSLKDKILILLAHREITESKADLYNSGITISDLFAALEDEASEAMQRMIEKLLIADGNIRYKKPEAFGFIEITEDGLIFITQGGYTNLPVINPIDSNNRIVGIDFNLSKLFNIVNGIFIIDTTEHIFIAHFDRSNMNLPKIVLNDSDYTQRDCIGFLDYLKDHITHKETRKKYNIWCEQHFRFAEGENFNITTLRTAHEISQRGALRLTEIKSLMQ